MQTTRNTCRTAAQPSRASPAPTKGRVVRLPGICGSWFASDADNSTHLPDRSAAIAGKPDSHKGWNGVVPRYLWELACQRCRQLGIPCRTAVQPSRASPALTKGGMVWLPGTCGSWLASDADNSTCLPDRGAAIAGKPGSHIRVICGSWLASDAGNSAYLSDRGEAIAGKPDSHKR